MLGRRRTRERGCSQNPVLTLHAITAVPVLLKCQNKRESVSLLHAFPKFNKHTVTHTHIHSFIQIDSYTKTLAHKKHA
jgi:hypothetical protein